MEEALGHFKNGEIDIAETLFSKAIDIYPDYFQAIYNVGIIKFMKNNFSEAENYIEKAFFLNSSDKYFSSVIDVYLSQKKIQKAENFLKDWENKINKEIIISNKNKITHQIEFQLIVDEYNSYNNNFTDDFEKKVASFSKKFPQNYVAWKLLGNILYQKKDTKDENFFNNLIKIFEKSYTLNNKDIDVILKLGSLYSDNNFSKKAIGLYSISKKILPNEHLLYFNCGNTFAKIGDIELAKDEYKKSIKMNPDHYYSYQNLAKAYKDLNEINKSEETYIKMIKLDNKNASGYRGLGAIRLLKSELIDAKEMLLKSINLDPNNNDAKQNLSICYLRLGETEKGVDCAKDNLGVLSFPIDKKYGKFRIIQ